MNSTSPLPQSAQDVKTLTRPIIYDYASVGEFFSALLGYYKTQGQRFSIRQRTQLARNCSPSLVTQVVKGKRRLTWDQLPAFEKIFKLTKSEVEYLDNLLRVEVKEARLGKVEFIEDGKKQRVARNHLLNNWLNPYVKDLVHLKEFKLDAKKLFKMLGGIATAEQVQRSIQFLLKEGFWRRNEKQEVVIDESVTVTTNEIPVEKIRQFHKQALKLALRGMDLYSVDRRKASTVLVSVDQDSLEELRSLINRFQTDLIEFIERHPKGDENLYQVVMHMTPVGSNNDLKGTPS